MNVRFIQLLVLECNRFNLKSGQNRTARVKEASASFKNLKN